MSDKGKVEIVNIGGGVVGLATFEPGWKWSEHVKPIAGTDSCQASHVGYVISGRQGHPHGRRHRARDRPG